MQPAAQGRRSAFKMLTRQFLNLITKTRGLLKRLIKRPDARASVLVSPSISGSDSNPYYRTGLDLDELRRTAETELERAYYGHRGKFIIKWRHYLPIYDRALTPFIGRKVKVLEIGVAEGGSAQLWKTYLGDQAQIIGVDIVPDAINHSASSIDIIIGDQGDEKFLRDLAETHGPFDVIIDDGSHISSHQILTFEVLFPHLKNGGVYICEDLHTSYWSDWGGGLGREDTFIAYLKVLIDRIHVRYYAGNAARDELTDQIGWVTVADSIALFFKQPYQETYMVPVPNDAEPVE